MTEFLKDLDPWQKVLLVAMLCGTFCIVIDRIFVFLERINSGE